MGSIFTNAHFNMFYLLQTQTEMNKLQDNPLDHRNLNYLDCPVTLSTYRITPSTAEHLHFSHA